MIIFKQTLSLLSYMNLATLLFSLCY